jgi:hypothetical protein
MRIGCFYPLSRGALRIVLGRLRRQTVPRGPAEDVHRPFRDQGLEEFVARDVMQKLPEANRRDQVMDRVAHLRISAKHNAQLCYTKRLLS